jgi:hypothetical protein
VGGGRAGQRTGVGPSSRAMPSGVRVC